MDDNFDYPASIKAVNETVTEKCTSFPVYPILQVGEEKLMGKGGLKKKMLRVGEGEEFLISGDEVEVHYVGTLLDGTQFGSSRDRDTPFQLKLDNGEVIRGLDEGIMTMRKGEKALFTIPPALAYGKSGSPPSIPPNATLKFEVELLSWTGVRDVCRDRGIVKKILTEGKGWQNPEDLDEVLVKYEARLEDGSLVSQSDATEFTVQDGYFCIALSKAVKGMRKGEKALLTVKPQYAFGEKGSPEHGIPPNAVLQFNLELTSWKLISHVTKDKKILKKILKQGEGCDRPKDGTVVKVKLIGKLQDGTIFMKRGHLGGEPFEFKVDEEQVVDGLERAIKTMKKGEISQVIVQPDYGFGSSKSQQELAVVPPHSPLIYGVEVVSFIREKESWEMNIQEKIEAAGKKKEEGNAMFNAGKYQRAIKRYWKATEFIEYDDSPFNYEEKQQVKLLLISIYLNKAACKLKLKEYKQSVKLCTKVIEEYGTTVKALYRRAEAYIELLDLDYAERDLKKALEMDPDNRFVKMEYRVLREKMKEYSKIYTRFYSNIFGKTNKLGELRAKYELLRSGAAASHNGMSTSIDSKA